MVDTKSFLRMNGSNEVSFELLVSAFLLTGTTTLKVRCRTGIIEAAGERRGPSPILTSGSCRRRCWAFP